MKILVNALSATLGGARRYIENLVSTLPDQGAGVEYILLVSLEQAASLRHLPGTVRVLGVDCPNRALSRLWFEQVTVRRLVKREGVDVAYCTGNFALFAPPCKQLLLVRNALYFSPYYRSRFVSRLHWRARAEYALRRWLVCRSARWADVVVTPSKSMLEECRPQIGGSAKFLVNPYGVVLERFQSPVPMRGSESPIRLLHVSHYADHKNVGVMFRALRLLFAWGLRDFRLSTTANIDDPRYSVSLSRNSDRAELSVPEVRSRVDCLGDVDYEQIPTLYRNHDIFIFPSVVESYGHPLVEAMASGLAVIAADINICRELCGDGALYFRPESPEDLAHKIKQLADDPARRRQLREAGFMRAKDMRWQSHVDRLLNILEEMHFKQGAIAC